MNWPSIAHKSFLEIGLLGYGAWVIWKQVYAVSPNGYLALIGFALMVPSARSSIIKILSGFGSSSSSSSPQVESQSQKSSGDTGDLSKGHYGMTG